MLATIMEHENDLNSPLLSKHSKTMKSQTTNEAEHAIYNGEEMGSSGDVGPVGFEVNQVVLADQHGPQEAEIPWFRNPHQITAMISNFSTSYNVVNISLVLPIMEQLYDVKNSKDAAASASSLLGGMILGQLIGGALGDSCMGRLGALRFVMILQIIASLGSSLLYYTGRPLCPTCDIYFALAAWRFLLGVGAGGVYPLAAVLSAEQGSPTATSNNPSSSHRSASSQVHRVVLTFSTQGLGFVSVPLVAVALLFITSDLDLVWRTLLGLGCVPGLCLMVLQWFMYENNHASRMERQAVPLDEPRDDDDDDDDDDNVDDDMEDDVDGEPILPTEMIETMPIQLDQMEPDGIQRVLPSNNASLNTELPSDIPLTTTGLWESIRHEPRLGQKLLGTAGTWFLFDVLFYGKISLFLWKVIQMA